LLTIAFGTSRETSDFIADCLEQWWQGRREHYGHIRELVINLDNGPELASGRTQFIKRLVEFADRYNLRIRWVYYPPYHSKYNPIERCWGILALFLGDWALEQHTTGERRDSAELGEDDDLERYPSGREIAGRYLRNRRASSEGSLSAIPAATPTLRETPQMEPHR